MAGACRRLFSALKVVAELRAAVIVADPPLDVRQLGPEIFTPLLFNQVVGRLKNTTGLFFRSETAQRPEKACKPHLFDILQAVVFVHGVLRSDMDVESQRSEKQQHGCRSDRTAPNENSRFAF